MVEQSSYKPSSEEKINNLQNMINKNSFYNYIKAHNMNHLIDIGYTNTTKKNEDMKIKRKQGRQTLKTVLCRFKIIY